MPVWMKINFSTVMEDKEKKNVVSAGDNLTDYMETVIADLEKKGNFQQHMFTGAYCALLPVFGMPLHRCEMIRHQCRTPLHQYGMSLRRSD